MSVQADKSVQASQKTETAPAKPEGKAKAIEVQVAEFNVPSNAIRMPLTLKNKVGDPKVDKKTGIQTGTRGMNGLVGDELGIKVSIYADARALKLDGGQEYDVVIIPRVK